MINRTRCETCHRLTTTQLMELRLIPAYPWPPNMWRLARFCSRPECRALFLLRYPLLPTASW